MTPAVADIADLVKILREQPEWAETVRSVLLSQELLDLPEKLAQLTVRLEEFIAQQTETNRSVAEQLARLTEQVSRLTEQLAQLTVRLEEFIAEQRETNRVFAERLTRLETDTAELKVTTARLEVDTAELKSDMSGVKATLGRIENRMDRMEGRIGRLEGAELERQVHANIAGIVCERLEINRPQVLKSIVVSTVPELFDLLGDAQAAGRIDRPQFLSLLRTDIILSARDDRARLIYVVIEISRTVHDYDLDRARERADILAAASSASTVALAMGYIIPPQQRRKAEDLGILLLESAKLEAVVDDED